MREWQSCSLNSKNSNWPLFWTLWTVTKTATVPIHCNYTSKGSWWSNKWLTHFTKLTNSGIGCSCQKSICVLRASICHTLKRHKTHFQREGIAPGACFQNFWPQRTANTVNCMWTLHSGLTGIRQLWPKQRKKKKLLKTRKRKRGTWERKQRRWKLPLNFQLGLIDLSKRLLHSTE